MGWDLLSMDQWCMYAGGKNLVEEVEDSPDFWSGPVQSYNSPVEHRFLIGLDWSTNGPLLDCDRKYVSVPATAVQSKSGAYASPNLHGERGCFLF